MGVPALTNNTAKRSASFRSRCCLMNREVISFKQTVYCFYRNAVRCQKCSKCSLSALTQIVLLLIYCRVDNTLLELRNQHRNSLFQCVKSQLVLSQFKTFFIFLSTKITRKRALVKLCDNNRSGPDFETHCIRCRVRLQRAAPSIESKWFISVSVFKLPSQFDMDIFPTVFHWWNHSS